MPPTPDRFAAPAPNGEPLRICFLALECYPFYYGGIGVQTLALMRLMRDRGHAISFLTAKFSNHNAPVLRETYAGIETFFLRRHTHAFEKHDALRQAYLVAQRLGQLHSQQPFHLLVAPDFRGPSFFVQHCRRSKERFTDLPVVVHLHGPLGDLLPHNRCPDDATTPLTTAMEDFVLRTADGIIAPTDMMRQTVVQRLHLDAARIPVVPNQLLDADRPAPAEQAAPVPRLVFAGRLERLKGVDLLVQAFAALRREARHGNLELVLFGEDQYWEEYGQGFVAHWSARLPPETLAAVDFQGFRPRQEVLATFAAASVCVFPSRFESFGLVALEAMAMGAPVVVSGLGTGLCEVTGPAGGVFFDPADGSQGLARVLDRLLSDDALRREVAAAGLARAARLGRETPALAAAALEEAARRGLRPPGGAEKSGQPGSDAVLTNYQRLAIAPQPSAACHAADQELERRTPQSCTLYLSPECNFRCQGCARQALGARSAGFVSLKLVQRLDSLYPDIPAYCLAGLGEPTSNPEFPAIVRFLAQQGKHVGVITNGSNPEPLLDAPPQNLRLSISLYGATPEAYRRQTGVDAFKRVMATFAALRPRFHHTGFSFVAARDNLDELQRILALCDVLRPNFLELHNFHAYDATDAAAQARTIRTEDVDILEQIFHLTRQRDYVHSLPAPLDASHPDFHCRAYLDHLSVDGTGALGSCPRRLLPDAALGTLGTGSDPFNQPPMLAKRALVVAGRQPHRQCRACFGRMPGGGSRLTGPPPQSVTTRLLSRVAACILFHEKPEQTIACVKSLLPSGVAVNLLNNGSSAQARRAVAEFCLPFPRVRLLDAKENLGVSGGRNRLLEAVQADWLFFLDNDIIVDTPDWPAILAALMLNHPDAEVFAPRTHNVHEGRDMERLFLDVGPEIVATRPAEDATTNLFPGGAAVVRQTLFDRLGNYDAAMFVGFEDFELCLRGAVLGRPVVVVPTDAIVLRHDHQPAMTSRDRVAILARYDEQAHTASLAHFAAKYPSLRFEHVWRGWIDDQVKTMLAPLDRRLSLSTAGGCFGCSRPVPALLAPAAPAGPGTGEQDRGLAARAREAAPAGVRQVVLLAGTPPPAKDIFAAAGFATIRTFSLVGDPAQACFFDGDDHQAMDRLAATLDLTQPWCVVLPGCLEYLDDPRPVLRLLKILLLAHSDNRAVVRLDGQGAARPWSASELEALLDAGGFQRSGDPAAGPELGPLWTLRLNRDHYDRFLALHSLPPVSTTVFVVSEEHAAAPKTGGIGTYVAELEHLAPPGSLGVCLYGQGEQRPLATTCRQKRLLVPERLLCPEISRALPLEERILEMAWQILYYYPFARQLECQDIGAPGFRLTQARRAGLFPSDVTVTVVLHGPWPYMEYGERAMLGLDFLPVMEREKIAVELADVVQAPTAFIRELCHRAGYRAAPGASRFQPHPFRFAPTPPPLVFEPVDTLIFFGKRRPYKGFDLFAEAVRLVLARTDQIKQVILLGPRLEEMTREDLFFVHLRDRVAVIEHDLPRQEALALIAAQAPRALCVLPYKNDNYPCSLLEVIGCRCQLLATATGGVPEMLAPHFHQHVLRPATAEALAQGMEAALTLSGGQRAALTADLYRAMAARQETINAHWRETLFPAALSPAAPAEPPSLPGIALVVPCTCYAPQRLAVLAEAIIRQVLPPEQMLCLAFGEEGTRAAAFLAERIPAVQTLSVAADMPPAVALDSARQTLTTPLMALLPEAALPSRSFLRDHARALAADPRIGAVSGYAALLADKPSDPATTPIARPLGNAGVLSGLLDNVYGQPAAAFRLSALEAAGGFVQSGSLLPDPSHWAVLARLRSLDFGVGVVTKVTVRFSANEWPKRDTDQDYRLQRTVAASLAGVTPFDLYRLSGFMHLWSRQSLSLSQDRDRAELLSMVRAADERIANQDALILARWEAMQAMAQAVAERDARIVAQDELILERGGAMQAMAQAVAERDCHIAQKDAVILERGEALEALEQAVVERDGRIAAQDALILERWEAMQAMAQAVAERDSRIAAQDALILERWEALQTMEQAVAKRDQRLDEQQALARTCDETIKEMGKRLHVQEQRILSYEASLLRRVVRTVARFMRKK